MFRHEVIAAPPAPPPLLSLRLCSLCSTEVGRKRLETLMQLCVEEEISVFEAGKRAGGQLASLLDFVETLRNSQPLSPADVLAHILSFTNYKDYLKSHYKEDFTSRWENVGEFVSLVSQDRFSLAQVKKRYEGAAEALEGTTLTVLALQELLTEIKLMVNASKA
jgi:hypothetical protein